MLVHYTNIIILTSYKNISLTRKEFLFDESEKFFDERRKCPHPPVNSNPTLFPHLRRQLRQYDTLLEVRFIYHHGKCLHTACFRAQSGQYLPIGLPLRDTKKSLALFYKKSFLKAIFLASKIEKLNPLRLCTLLLWRISPRAFLPKL